MAKPTLLAKFDRNLAFKDRAAGGTLTATGPVRYGEGMIPAAIPGTQNLLPYGSFAHAAVGVAPTGWAMQNITAISDNVWDGIRSALCTVTGTAPSPLLYSSTIGYPPASAGQTYVASGEVRNTSQVSRQLQITLVWLDSSNAFVAQTGSTSVMLAPGESALISISGVAPANTAKMRSQVMMTGSTIGDTFRVRRMQIELGSVATPYAEGTMPNHHWLGAAHASPSVRWGTKSQAYFTEEGTTNQFFNPYLTENGNYWSSYGGGGGRVTGLSIVHPQTGQVLTAAYRNSTWTGNNVGAITRDGLNPAAGTVWTASVVVVGSATAIGKQVRINIVELGGVSEGQTTNGPLVTMTGAPQILHVTRTVAQADRTRIDAYVDTQGRTGGEIIDIVAGQIEQKAYPTSVCPQFNYDGTLMSGYTWAGTAHASASTRANAYVDIVNAGHFDSSMNGGFTFVARLAPIGTNPITSATLWLANQSTNWPAGPVIQRLTDGTIRLAPKGNGSGGFNTPAPIPVGEFHTYILSWDGTTFFAHMDTSLLGQGTSQVPQLGVDTSNRVGGFNSPVQQAALWDDILVFDRPLTAAERAHLVNAQTWEWDTLFPILGGVLRVGGDSPIGGVLRVGRE